jgi:arylsulfatase A
MIPTIMKKAGYVTAQVGKWNQLPLQPGDWGFDEYLRFPASGRYWRQQTPTYTVNGQQKDLPQGVYLPDLMHDFAVDFITRNHDKPFFLYYPMSHIHGPIVRTPDSKGESPDLYADNVAYMDKLVGKLIAELERQHLREKTVVFFVGDNGTAANWAERCTVNGKQISGAKASMLEGGSRVPCIVNWPGTTPAGKVRQDLVDFSDFFPTIAELGGAALPEKVKLDGHSLAARLRGEKAEPREWIYVELNGKRYVRDDRYKLTGLGELLDLKDAPYEETPITSGQDSERKKLQAVLDDLGSQGFVPKAAQQSPATEPSNRRERRQMRRRQRTSQPTAAIPADRVS